MMKKFIAALALVAVVAGPNAALAVGITTGMTKGTAGGNAPEVLVKWEMNGAYTAFTGLDDATTTAGAQFLPTGIVGSDKQISICGIVMDVDGVANIDNVYSNTWYPEEIYLGSAHEDGRLGCGQEMGTQCLMTQLTKEQGLNLFCSNIQTNNNSLPVFDNITAKGWDYICKADGELQKETAYVACCNRTLSYEDPAGDYEVLVSVADNDGNNDILGNEMTYLPVTGIQADFTAVNYGDVRLNTEKVINGDLTWASGSTGLLPSVRNTGNTRVQLSATQNDMGLGLTGDVYNVTYKTRVGNVLANWSPYYDPFATQWLNESLDLSETNEIDFGIKVTKFPAHLGTSFTGTLTLGSQAATALDCDGYPNLDKSPNAN